MLSKLFGSLSNRLAVSIIGSCMAVSVVQAAPVTVPADLLPGQGYRLVFVTSESRLWAPIGIASYNEFVQAVANSQPELAALGTTWKAIVTTTEFDPDDDFFIRARDNTSTNPTTSIGVPIYRLDGARIANNNADLWDGSIAAPISLTQTGNPAIPVCVDCEFTQFGPGVWAGTQIDGTEGVFCAVIGDPCGATLGDFSASNEEWIRTRMFGFDDGRAYPVYAISGVLFVPAPAPLATMVVGLAGLGFWRVRSRKV